LNAANISPSVTPVYKEKLSLQVVLIEF
jgi:hypothetical protein